MTALQVRCPGRGWTCEDPPRDPFEAGMIAAGATGIVHDRWGRFRGVYVDNETPDRWRVVDSLDAIRRSAAGSWVILVGLYPREAGTRHAGAICLTEWYPHPDYPGTPLPRGQQGFIVQWSYARPGARPPTCRQRWSLYLRALAMRTRIVCIY